MYCVLYTVCSTLLYSAALFTVQYNAHTHAFHFWDLALPLDCAPEREEIFSPMASRVQHALAEKDKGMNTSKSQHRAIYSFTLR